MKHILVIIISYLSVVLFVYSTPLPNEVGTIDDQSRNALPGNEISEGKHRHAYITDHPGNLETVDSETTGQKLHSSTYGDDSSKGVAPLNNLPHTVDAKESDEDDDFTNSQKKTDSSTNHAFMEDEEDEDEVDEDEVDEDEVDEDEEDEDEEEDVDEEDEDEEDADYNFPKSTKGSDNYSFSNNGQQQSENDNNQTAGKKESDDSPLGNIVKQDSKDYKNFPKVITPSNPFTVGGQHASDEDKNIKPSTMYASSEQENHGSQGAYNHPKNTKGFNGHYSLFNNVYQQTPYDHAIMWNPQNPQQTDFIPSNNNDKRYPEDDNTRPKTSPLPTVDGKGKSDENNRNLQTKTEPPNNARSGDNRNEDSKDKFDQNHMHNYNNKITETPNNQECNVQGQDDGTGTKVPDDNGNKPPVSNKIISEYKTTDDVDNVQDEKDGIITNSEPNDDRQHNIVKNGDNNDKKKIQDKDGNDDNTVPRKVADNHQIKTENGKSSTTNDNQSNKPVVADENNQGRKNENPQNNPANDNPENQPTNENSQNQLTNGNSQNKPPNKNLQNPTTNGDLPNPSTNGYLQHEPTNNVKQQPNQNQNNDRNPTPNPTNVPNPVPNLNNVPNTVPNPNKVPNLLPNPNTVPNPAPNPNNVPNSVPNPNNVPNTVPNPNNVPNTLPNPNTVPNPAPNPNNVPNPVPNPTKVPNPVPNQNNGPNTIPNQNKAPNSKPNQNNVAKPNQNQNNGGQGKKKKNLPKPLKAISNTANKAIVKPVRNLFKRKG